MRTLRTIAKAKAIAYSFGVVLGLDPRTLLRCEGAHFLGQKKDSRVALRLPENDSIQAFAIIYDSLGAKAGPEARPRKTDAPGKAKMRTGISSFHDKSFASALFSLTRT